MANSQLQFDGQMLFIVALYGDVFLDAMVIKTPNKALIADIAAIICTLKLNIKNE